MVRLHAISGTTTRPTRRWSAPRGIDRTFTIKDPAAPGGVRTQTWHYPSRAECMACHSRAANFVLGPSTLQMNKDHDYPAPGGGVVRDNQLRTLEHLGVLRTDYAAWSGEAIRRDLKRRREARRGARPAGRAPLRRRTSDSRSPRPSCRSPLPSTRPSWTRPTRRRTSPFAPRATCTPTAPSATSKPAAATRSSTWSSPLRRTNTRIFDATPQHDTFGIADARIIARGDPARSVLLHRMSTRGPGQMPPLATTRVDEEAIRMLKEWVEGMGRSGEK